MLGVNALLPTYARPPRGMIVRSEVTLEPATMLHRLGSSMVRGVPQTRDDLVTSPWWVGQADFDEIMRRARASGTAPADLWRQFGAIARQWGASCDRLVSAKLKAPLGAYIGPGTVQDLRGLPEAGNELPLWVPPSWVTQIYIPGLCASMHDSATSVADFAFSDVVIRFI